MYVNVPVTDSVKTDVAIMELVSVIVLSHHHLFNILVFYILNVLFCFYYNSILFMHFQELP